MTDIFQVLKRDHEAVDAMLGRLEADRIAADGDPDRLRSRQKLVERVIIEESTHEAAEEEYFWPAVRAHVAGGDQLADEAIEQEQRAKRILGDLDGLDADHESFEELLTAFIEAARAHIAFEETRVWPRLRAVLSREQAGELGGRLVKGKLAAPTHPHPDIAPEPGILRSSGPMTAAADRIRDAATGRGRE
jgi:hemerythrin superfamily protein